MNLIKADMKNNLNEAILHNIVSFQEVQYPPVQLVDSRQDLSILNEHKFSLLASCQKQCKDVVRQAA
jgi:hypothetical protein